jgi:SAM-dependent methyltransferase
MPVMPDGAFDKNSSEWQHKVYRTHWWFRARMRILDKIISHFISSPVKAIDILEIGCGVGPNLSMLSKHGHVKGLENSESALEIVHRTLPGIPVKEGWFPDNIDVWGQSFDWVCAFDVLEHVEDDEKSLCAMKKIIKMDGFLFLALPAYQWLFGPYDSSGGHYRRYNKKDIVDKLHRNGYVIKYSTYINTLLFPCVLIGRLAEKIQSRQSVTPKALQVPNSFLNNILYRIFVSESFYIPIFSSPFGSSLLVVAQKGNWKKSY